MEVAAGIHRIEVPFGERIVCLFLLVGEEGALLIDTGTDEMPGQYLVPYLDQIGLAPERIRYVVNSHADFDHTAGNRSVRELCPGAVFMCHALDQAMVEDIEVMIEQRYSEWEADHDISDGDEAKAFIRQASRTVPMDVLLQGGEKIRLGAGRCVEVQHTAGHTWGHLSINDPASKTLIIADATLHNAVPQADGQPAFPPTYRYVDTYLASMHRFAAAPIDTLLASHYPVYRGAAIGEFLAESRAFVERVDQALVAQLQAVGSGCTMRELTEALSPQLGQWPAAAGTYLCFPLQGHLERLLAHGKVVTGRRDKLMTFSWK